MLTGSFSFFSAIKAGNVRATGSQKPSSSWGSSCR